MKYNVTVYIAILPLINNIIAYSAILSVDS